MKWQLVKPFEPIIAQEIPKGPDWIHQIKWDGVRLLTYFDGQEIKLFNRHQKERTEIYPELTDGPSFISARSVILDGEVIALGADGKPSFHEVMRRDGIRRSERIEAIRQAVPIFYMIFDLLYYNDHWINKETLQQRLQLLSQVVKPNDTVHLTLGQANGASLYERVRQQNMEGIVAKKLDSSYLFGGKDGRWQKIKNYKDLIAIVGGASYRQGRMNALLLGLYNNRNRLIYIGRSGRGKLTAAEWENIGHLMDPLKINASPFFNPPGQSRQIQWIRPALTVKIIYTNWTASSSLRQPVTQSWVRQEPKLCRFEETS